MIVVDLNTAPTISLLILLSPEAPAGMTSAYQHLEAARPLLYSIFQGKDSLLVLRRIRDWNAREIVANLRTAFAEIELESAEAVTYSSILPSSNLRP
jgi:hypothetical protein